MSNISGQGASDIEKFGSRSVRCQKMGQGASDVEHRQISKNWVKERQMSKRRNATGTHQPCELRQTVPWNIFDLS